MASFTARMALVNHQNIPHQNGLPMFFLFRKVRWTEDGRLPTIHVPENQVWFYIKVLLIKIHNHLPHLNLKILNLERFLSHFVFYTAFLQTPHTHTQPLGQSSNHLSWPQLVRLKCGKWRRPKPLWFRLLLHCSSSWDTPGALGRWVGSWMKGEEIPRFETGSWKEITPIFWEL